MDNITKPQQRGFYLNPQGKTSVSVLHELIQKILKCAVYYSFSETRFFLYIFINKRIRILYISYLFLKLSFY